MGRMQVRRASARRWRVATLAVPAALAMTLTAGPSAVAAPVASAPVVTTAAATGLFPSGPRDINCLRVKCVALTFDDGPGARTYDLLRMLRRAKARATFFPVGEVASRRPAKLRAIDRAGHQIGNHTWSHSSLPLLSPGGIADQVRRTANTVERITGDRPRLVRPPYGALTGRVTGVLDNLHAPIVLWDVDPLDWKYRNSTTVHRNVMRQVRPGSIVLLHDIHSTTVSAVPRILASLKKRGYHFVTVTELYGHQLKSGHVYTGRAKAYARAHRG